MRPRLRRFALLFEVYPRGHGGRVGLGLLGNDDTFPLRDLLGVQHLCRAYRFGVGLPKRFTLGFLGVAEFDGDIFVTAEYNHVAGPSGNERMLAGISKLTDPPQDS